MKSKISSLLLLVVLVLVLFGCAATVTTEQVMKSWLGHDKVQLTTSWGPPNRITSDGKDGEIYIYEKTSTSATTFTNIFGIELDNPITTVNTSTEYRQFYIDEQGKIYYVRWGNN